ncbi:type III polyketide synthase [Myxococcota bacterium]|nr:type III polyketide synthase [Myxococcota bacterium]
MDRRREHRGDGGAAGGEVPHPAILSVGTALPPHRVGTDELASAVRRLWGRRHFNADRVDELHRALQVGTRHLALPLAEYPGLHSFARANDAWTRVAVELGEEAVARALARAGLVPRDVDHVFFVTVTGISTPTVDARLVSRLGLRPDVRRTPIFGLGCVAGAAGLCRAADWLRAYPRGVAVLLSVELCSLTLQREDLSVAAVIAAGLFGDGAAAAVVVGGARAAGAGPGIASTGAVFYPGTERLMGWDVVDTGLKVVLSPEVPRFARERIAPDVLAFLARHGLAPGDVRHFLVHTGGPKVLTAFEESLALPEGALARSWRSLRAVGNLSSASVLFVLGDLLEEGAAGPGDVGLLVAMGPGFCAEMALLRW